MIIIEAKLIIEDANNLSNEDARQSIVEIISEAFEKEEFKECPRVRLILMEVKHK